MDDPDGIPIVGYSWVHWDVYQIPAATRQIPEGATASAKMPSGSVEGRNNDDLAKYSGPCPPMGTGSHRYVFALYALNTETLNVATNTPLNRSAFETKYAKEIIQKVEITTQYGQ
jgi:Raf kinase inhibitor-like YbhB/YbcL family protein